MTTKTIKVATGTTFAALLALTMYVLAQAFPGSEAVRLRNSLLITSAKTHAGDWTPEKSAARAFSEVGPLPKQPDGSTRGVPA